MGGGAACPGTQICPEHRSPLVSRPAQLDSRPPTERVSRRTRSSRCPGPSTSVELSAPRSDDGRDCDGRQHRRAAQEEGLQQQRLLQRGEYHGAAAAAELVAGSSEAAAGLPSPLLPLPHPPPSPGRPGQQDGADAELWVHDHGHPVGGGPGVAPADAVGADG